MSLMMVSSFICIPGMQPQITMAQADKPRPTAVALGSFSIQHRELVDPSAGKLANRLAW